MRFADLKTVLNGDVAEAILGDEEIEAFAESVIDAEPDDDDDSWLKSDSHIPVDRNAKLQIDADINLDSPLLKDVLADNPGNLKQTSDRNSKNKDASVADDCIEEEDENFDVTQVDIGDFSWDN